MNLNLKYHIRLILLSLEESLKNTPLNPFSDSCLEALIILRFESGLFGKVTLSTNIFGISL